MQAGGILATSLSVYGRNFAPFALLAGLVFLPLLVVEWSSADRLLERSSAEGGGLATVLEMMLPYVLMGAVAYGVFQELTGHRAPFVECVVRGLSRLARVLGVAVIVSIALAFVLVIPMGVLGVFDVILGVIGGLAGLTFLVLLTVMWYVAVPAAVVEARTGPLKALGRSAELTRGSRTQLFLVVLVLGIVAWGSSLLVELALVGTASTEGALRLALVARYATVALVSTWQAIAAAVAYHDLRVAREGIDARDIVRVFD